MSAHCRSPECRATARDHVLVPDGPGDEVRRHDLDACGCFCAGCDDENTRCGWRAPMPLGEPRQMEMFG